MPKTPPPLLGFNNNVKHRGRIFHIQTEDSGVKRPHVITHLFADGGRIVRSKKNNYAEHVGQDDTVALVRKVMKTQHKAMFIALRGGDFDDLIEGICGEHPLPPAPIPEKLKRAREAARAKLDSIVDKPAEAVPEPEPKAAPAPASSSPQSKPRPSKRLSNPNLQRVTADQATSALANAELDIDVEKHLSDRPVPQPPGATPVHGTPAAARKSAPKKEPQAPATVIQPEEPGRYAASRPAAIFDSRPDEGSIFGGGISEQSLDDVILSYIAEDLEEDAPPE